MIAEQGDGGDRGKNGAETGGSAGRAYETARVQEQGTGSVQLFLFARLAGAAAWDRRLQSCGGRGDYNEQLDELRRHYLTQLRNGARRMDELIDDLLELSRMGRAELRHERIDSA